jgi:hypothetical protein
LYDESRTSGTVPVELWKQALMEGHRMQDAQANPDDREQGAQAATPAPDAAAQAQRRELRAAAAAEAGYILRVLGR